MALTEEKIKELEEAHYRSFLAYYNSYCPMNNVEKLCQYFSEAFVRQLVHKNELYDEIKELRKENNQLKKELENVKR